mgnify:CR=1 FL=1
MCNGCYDLIQAIRESAPSWTPSEATPLEALAVIIRGRDQLRETLATERRAREQAEERARVAEGRLRTLDRMAHTGGPKEDADAIMALGDPGWYFRGKTLATIGDLADAWAAAHKEG